MIQREVAERLLAPPGNRNYGLITVNVNRMAEVEMIAQVSRNCFYPSPESGFG